MSAWRWVHWSLEVLLPVLAAALVLVVVAVQVGIARGKALERRDGAGTCVEARR